jgi:glycosyltransferase involved in cell wall biosynthesis
VNRPLLVSHTGEPGGSNAVLAALLEHRPGGTEPACVFLAPGPEEGRAARLGARVAVVPTGRAREVHKAPRAVGALRGAIRAHRADLVFAHTTKAHLYAAAAAALEGVPYLWWQHKLPGQERFDALADRLPAGAIVCSSEWTAALQRRRSPRTAVHTIHPGTALPPDPGPREGEGVVLAARLQRWKRVERLVAAVPHVLEALPGTRFTVLGGEDPAIDPGYLDELRALAGRLGAGDAVTFAGHVPDAAERIGRAAVLAHAAGEEPFGLVLVEALARRVPVVGPAEGGAAEIVRDGTDGLLVDVADPRAFAGALVALLRDPARRAAMGAAGRERVAERFTVERMAASAWALSRQVAARPRR